MKRSLTIYITLGIAALSAGCKLTNEIIDNVGPLPRLPNWGCLTADMNGSDWSKSYKNAYQVTHGIVSYTDESQGSFFALKSVLHTSEGYDRQNLIFQKIPFSPLPGRLNVASCTPRAPCESSDKPQVALYELLSDGDVAGDFFYTVDSEDNYIQIDSYNPKTQEIKGSFQLTLANARIPRSSNVLPDTLRFRNGRFHTRIIEYKGRGG